jgi:hypothetical protein
VFSDRHARSEPRIQNRRTPSPLLPPAAFGQLKIAAPEHACQQSW